MIVEFYNTFILVFYLIQLIFVVILSFIFKRRFIEFNNWSKISSYKWPNAEVILCLRGTDQNLYDLLKKLSKQIYLGTWQLQIIIDSLDDNSLKIVKYFQDNHSIPSLDKPSWQNLNIDFLTDRPKEGSLKCASLLKAFNNLNKESSVIAFVDADASISNDWLSHLVRSCSQPGVGAVSGNRWYKCQSNNMGAWIRSIWNYGALTLMTIYSIPWGGTLAVRREVIDQGDWPMILKDGLCEDTGLIDPLKKLNLRYVFRPELIITNKDEKINLFDLSDWLTRQLLTTRIHHSSWILVFLHSLCTFLVLAIAILNSLWFSLLLYELGCLILLVWIEFLVNKKVLSIRKLFLYIIPCQFLYSITSFRSLIASKIEWSGVIYRISRKHPYVKIIHYPK